jgi:putative ABC transport system substrate-binding protein
MRRRDLILGTAAGLMPRRVFAATPRRLGVLMLTPANDSMGQADKAALVQGLAALDWHEGDNLRTDWRWAGGSVARYDPLAAELMALDPDILVAGGSASVAALRRRAGTTPIVFAEVTDPIGQGFVKSLAHPGGNITGFSAYDPPMAGKWLEMLAQMTPPITRVAVLYNEATAPYSGKMLHSLEGAAPSFHLAVEPVPVDDDAGVDAAMAAIARRGQGGVLVLQGAFPIAHRAAILAAAARHRLPAVYPLSVFAATGGLMSYGFDAPDLFRRAAAYVDRILKGANPADLPVQQPTKYELVVNLKTAKALGLTASSMLLAQANDVIE